MTNEPIIGLLIIVTWALLAFGITCASAKHTNDRNTFWGVFWGIPAVLVMMGVLCGFLYLVCGVVGSIALWIMSFIS